MDPSNTFCMITHSYCNNHGICLPKFQAILTACFFFFFLFRLAKVFVCRTLQYFQQSQLYSLPSYVCGNIKTLQ